VENLGAMDFLDSVFGGLGFGEERHLGQHRGDGGGFFGGAG
jgi:hypothetical protein